MVASRSQSHSRPQTPQSVALHMTRQSFEETRHSNERDSNLNPESDLKRRAGASTTSLHATPQPSVRSVPKNPPFMLDIDTELPWAQPLSTKRNSMSSTSEQQHTNSRAPTPSPRSQRIPLTASSEHHPNRPVTSERGRSFDHPPERPARSAERKRSASLGRNAQSPVTQGVIPPLPDVRGVLSSVANASLPSLSSAHSPKQSPVHSVVEAHSLKRSPSHSVVGTPSLKRSPSHSVIGRAARPVPDLNRVKSARREETRGEEISVIVMDGRGRFAHQGYAMDILRGLAVQWR
ncbi:hypothetical protein BKA62DRAFT_708007 [Auriculariales sp. MPI-PUGE-AT-0066]|nr:hypothetical protein BKA62DRAFT_708007 [Auriculariales sp. MPI-PUGE-AT-0066]